MAAGGSTAVQLASWQYIYGGTWSPQEYADYNSFKNLICAIIAVTPVCWTPVPFENARRAYYADKTWPLEMRRNYTSPTNALLRIPFEEGPSFLFRGGAPIIAHQWIFWTTVFCFYSWMKNKTFFMWIYQDFPYDYIKCLNLGFSFAFASFLAYPMLACREMVDIWPKERGGHCTWNNNYRQCMKWMIENMDHTGFNFYHGYWTWFRRYGVVYLGSIWVADNLGMMSNGNEEFNGLEAQNAIFSEST